MAKDLKFYLTVWLKDRATKELDGVRKGILRIGDAVKAVRAGPGAALRFGGPISGFLLGGLSVAIKAVQSLIGIVAGVIGSIVGLVVGAIRTIIRAIEGVSGFIIGTLVKIGKVAGVAVGAATAAFILFTRQVVVAGDALADMSKRTGLSVKFLSEMKSVLEKADASLESVRTAIRSLGRAVEGAVRGEKEYVDLWRQLGVSLTDQNGKLRTSEDLFVAVVDALRRIPNELVRVGMAQRIFGRSADELMVLINNTTESLAEQRAEAQRLGATWTNKLAAAADRVADAWVDLRTAWENMKAAGLGPFFTSIEGVFRRLTNYVVQNQARVNEWGQTAAAWAEHVAKVLVEKVGAAWDWISTRAFSWDALKAGAAGALQLIRDQAGNVLDWLLARLTVLKTHALDAVDEVIAYIARRWGQTFNAIAGDLTAIAARLQTGAVKEADKTGGVWATSKGAPTPFGSPLSWVGRAIFGTKLSPAQAAQAAAGRAVAGAGTLVTEAGIRVRERGAEAPGAALAREAERLAAEAAAARFAEAFSQALAQQIPQIVGAAFPAKATGANLFLAAVSQMSATAAAAVSLAKQHEDQIKQLTARLKAFEQSLRRMNQSKR